MNTKKLKQMGWIVALAAFVAGAANMRAGDDAEMEFEGKKAYLGVYVESVPSLVSSQLGLDDGVGVVVEKLVKDGPAEKGGLKKHDILLKFDDQILIGTKQVVVLVRNSEIGSEHEISLLRGGKEMSVTVTLGETEYRKSKMLDDQSFFHFQSLPHPPAAPKPPNVTIVAEQRRAMDALARAQDRLARAAESERIHTAVGEDFTRTMELNEEIEVLMERVNRASVDAQNVSMPTIVFNGPERVFEFSDDDGKRFLIVEEDGEQQLTVIGADGEESYQGPLTDDAREMLPQGLREGLPEFEKIVQVRAPVWVQDGGVETF